RSCRRDQTFFTTTFSRPIISRCLVRRKIHECVRLRQREEQQSRGAANKLESSDIPLLASPRGGVAERSTNIAKHPLFARPGWCPDENKKENHPGCVGFGGFAKFLMTQPPLLAVMQGGD